MTYHYYIQDDDLPTIYEFGLAPKVRRPHQLVGALFGLTETYSR